MSDMSAQTSAVNAEMAEPGGALLLRQARERAGLHVVALAAMLKVPVQKLEALEAGRFDELPDATFARALASSVCRALKVDPAPVLASLPQPKGVRLVEEGMGINTPFRQPSRRETTSADASAGGSRMSRPGMAAAVLLILAAVLWFALPDDGSWNLGNMLSPANGEAAQALATVPVPVDNPIPAAESVTPAVATPSLPDLSQPSSASQQSLSVPAAPVAAAIPPAAAGASAAAPAAAPAQEAEAAQQALTMRAKEASWVQVTGASGRVLVQRSLQAGEVVSVGTDLPLSVVVGRADETEVRVRGAAFDLAPYARNNVARFEVR